MALNGAGEPRRGKWFALRVPVLRTATPARKGVVDVHCPHATERARGGPHPGQRTQASNPYTECAAEWTPYSATFLRPPFRPNVPAPARLDRGTLVPAHPIGPARR